MFRDYHHTMPLNTVSTLLIENDKILTLVSGDSHQRSFPGGWITRGFDGAHTIKQAIDSAMIKLCQETGNGESDEDIEKFFKLFHLRVTGSFSFDKQKWGHLVVVVRLFGGDKSLIGDDFGVNRYPVSQHKWWPISAFDNACNMKWCARRDIKMYHAYLKSHSDDEMFGIC